MTINDLSKNISDHFSSSPGALRNINDVIEELERLYNNMSIHQLFLKGKKEMLGEVINYLKSI
jgi:hypothetical protein